MEAVLDSVSLNHFLRRPKKARKSNRLETPLDPYLRQRVLLLGLDAEKGLASEWVRTCGEEVVRQVLNQWEAFGAIILVNALARYNTQVSRRLRQVGVRDTIDKLILRIALSL